MYNRRVFLVTEDDEYPIGTVDSILTEDNIFGAHTANSVIRGVIERMVFGDSDFTDETKQLLIQIR
ncbi:hypothetical protein LCGC14_1589350 [marine sediment metagenome]|uniref:Uncharacterized protein n=1 Tax=marine sediment metagenome TaxID=412755 RepID=A0A0F9J0P7_9ZZZZ